MVYLTRTGRVTKDWEKAWEFCTELSRFFKENYKDIEDVQLLTNIAGRLDEFHWVLTFESLAKEEEIAMKLVADERYMMLLKKGEGFFSDFVDNLYRSVDLPG